MAVPGPEALRVLRRDARRRAVGAAEHYGHGHSTRWHVESFCCWIYYLWKCSYFLLYSPCIPRTIGRQGATSGTLFTHAHLWLYIHTCSYTSTHVIAYPHMDILVSFTYVSVALSSSIFLIYLKTTFIKKSASRFIPHTVRRKEPSVK